MEHRIIFATSNEGKMREVREILKGLKAEVLSMKEAGVSVDIVEDGDTFEANAKIKARAVWEKTGGIVLADDSGLAVDYLNGEPGVYSARYAGPGHDSEANMRKLLADLEGESNRKARFRTVIALILDGKEYLFEGIVNGHIIEEKKGSAGFGYDPIFVPDGYNQTFAELGDDIKNRISHRAMATHKLAEFLSNIPKQES